MKQHPLFAHLRPLNGAWGDITTAVGSPQIGFVLGTATRQGQQRDVVAKALIQHPADNNGVI